MSSYFQAIHPHREYACMNTPQPQHSAYHDTLRVQGLLLHEGGSRTSDTHVAPGTQLRQRPRHAYVPWLWGAWQQQDQVCLFVV